MTDRPPGRPLWQEELLEWLEGWWPGIALGLGALLLWGGFALPGMGKVEAYIIIVAFPLIALGLAGLALREVRGLALAVGIAATVAAALAAEARISQVLLPPAPYGVAMLRAQAADATRGATDATIEVPGDVQALRVTVHGDLAGESGQSSVGYALVLERSGARRLVKGELTRQVSQGQGFSLGPPSTSVTLHETEAHEVTLPGPGPVQVHLNTVDGEQRLRVTVAPAATGAHVFELGLVAALVLAVLAQALAARRQRRIQLTALVGAAAVFALAVGRWLNPDGLLMFAIGTALLGVFAGGLGGWLLGAIASRMARPRPRNEPAAEG